MTAHEFGHNWGSEHDPDTSECSPSASQVQPGYYDILKMGIVAFFPPYLKRSVKIISFILFSGWFIFDVYLLCFWI